MLPGAVVDDQVTSIDPAADTVTYDPTTNTLASPASRSSRTKVNHNPGTLDARLAVAYMWINGNALHELFHMTNLTWLSSAEGSIFRPVLLDNTHHRVFVETKLFCDSPI
jgi:hypothetical protein